jgi:imidazolonepropionase-like amidohydrolase
LGFGKGLVVTAGFWEQPRTQSRAGLSFQQILASLTISPAQRFGYATRRGRIAEGWDGGLVVLESDPAQSPTAFSKVRYTIIAGKVVDAGNGNTH